MNNYNPYVQTSITFEHFFVRKVMLVKYSYAPSHAWRLWHHGQNFRDAYACADKIIVHFPLVLFGKEYYQPLMAYMNEMAEKGTISPEDLSLVLLTDSVAEAAQHIETFIQKNYRSRPPRRKWWLFEPRPAGEAAVSAAKQ